MVSVVVNVIHSAESEAQIFLHLIHHKVKNSNQKTNSLFLYDKTFTCTAFLLFQISFFCHRSLI